MEFPSDVVLVPDNSEPESHSEEKVIASGLENLKIEGSSSSSSSSNCDLPGKFSVVQGLRISDPEVDLEVCASASSGDNSEPTEAFAGNVETVSTPKADKVGESRSNLSSTARYDLSILDSVPLHPSPPDLASTAGVVTEVSNLSDDSKDMRLDFRGSEDVVQIIDNTLEDLVPVGTVHVGDELSSERMLLVDSDDVNVEEMTITDDQVDIESDCIPETVEVAVGINELSMPLHAAGGEENSTLLAHDSEFHEPQNSIACELEDFCSPKSLLKHKENAECDGEYVSRHVSDEVVKDNTKNCAPLNTPGDENTSTMDSCFNLLLPSSPDSPSILNEFLIPTSSPMVLATSGCNNKGSTSSYNKESSVATLDPAEWCQHCGVLAPSSPDQFLPDENCIANNTRGALEHSPDCRYFEESESGPCSEAVADSVTCDSECRSDTEVSNSKAKEPCILDEVCGDAEFNLAPPKSSSDDSVAIDFVQDVMVSSQRYSKGGEGCDTASSELLKQVATDESKPSYQDEEEVFEIDAFEATAELDTAFSPVPESINVTAQDLGDLKDDLEVAEGVRDMETFGTQNDSSSNALIPIETCVISATPLTRESGPLTESLDDPCDKSERQCNPVNHDDQIETQESDKLISSNETPVKSLLDNEVATAVALRLEPLKIDPDDDFEESLSGNDYLTDNPHNLYSQSPSSVSDRVPCSGSNSLSDFSSTKGIVLDSDSCGPSPEPTDVIDISCGISVLFEKCKNRRDGIVLSCSSSKIDKTSRSMVATSENISSQLEKSAIAESTSHVSTLPCDASSDKSGFAENICVQSSVSNFSKEVSVPTSNHLLSPERKFGVSLSPGNCPILEETDDDLRQSASSENAAKTLLFKHTHDKTQHFKNPSVEHVVTTSAPCSPVPQPHRASSMTGVTSRKRKGNKCVRRRVSFPENDKQLITSYLEPVDPWERMKRSVNSDEVLRAYTTSCRSHGCQPMPIVVNQIAALPLNVPGRVECFSLRCCKLELGQCEGLEEIFKRVQFVCIDLENCSLSDDTVMPLLDMIEFYDSTTHLNISGNSNIGVRGWQACSRMLKKNQSVRSLNARGTNLNEVNMPILGKALKLGSRLHTLHLENCNLTGRSLITLTAALKLNDTVVKLYLADNRLGSNDCIQIGNLLRTNLTLKLLDLRNNNLQDLGCAHVCEGIAEQSKSKLLIEADSMTDKQDVKKWGLNSLVLWNNHITVSAAKHLASMMLASTSIETLNVGRNSVSNDGAIRLKEALLRNKSLKRLYLHATKIGDEGAVALAELLAESKNIERVDLRENAIKVAGLMALAHSLRHNTSMVQMDLDSNPRSEPLEELAEKHVSLLLEIKEYTQRNRAESQAQHTLAESKEADSEDYYLDPDFRKLSLSSEIDGSQTLEIPTATPPPNRAVSIALGSGVGSEEPKKYRSPSPSPCASPVPSPSLSPVPPTPFKNRFKVFKVSSATSPAGSCVVTANPIYSGNGTNSLSSSAFCNLSSSAPSSSLPTPIISTTSRPVVHHPQPSGRNRFLSGGRFTVTKVSDTSMHQSSSIMKCKSLSLPQIPLIEPVKQTEPSSPKIVISSPAKIERGFSLEESTAESKLSSTSTVSRPCVSNEDESAASAVKIRTDSSESDDVFVDSVFSQSDTNSSVTLRADQKTTGAVVSPVFRSRRDLTDSGFLEETAADFEDAVSNLPVRPVHDGDRDSLFSNTSDPDGHSPLTPLPPTDSGEMLPVSPKLQEAAALPSIRDPPSSKSGEFLSSLPSRLGVLFRGIDRGTSSNLKLQSFDENRFLDGSSSCVGEVTSQPKRAPLASMENGSMDTDSEDSEVTTQSSDSTHSDEVRITSVEAAVEPVQAWGDSDAKAMNSDLEGLLSSKNIDSEEGVTEEFLPDGEKDKTQSEVKNERSEDDEQLEAQEIVEPLKTDL
ncbi:Leucine-rich repeat [Trinorchestia longiramus]|nr:Leucine-rich repeat [Trinorchestia longiramus]